jgi:hypothetical protein
VLGEDLEERGPAFAALVHDVAVRTRFLVALLPDGEEQPQSLAVLGEDVAVLG